MPIINMQRRSRELGRIRTGQKGDRGQPQKLSKFRLTSSSKPLLEKVAQLYGGTAREWTPSGGAPQWEVFTEVSRIPIIVPPQPVSQWYETWKAGGCKHRCDGETNFLTGELCDLEDPDHINAKPTTRLKVILRDVEGVGVWRLESHGFNAAVELPDAAELLAQAGGFIEGHLALEERVTKSIKPDGSSQTNRFLVPIIEVGVTPAELFAGKGRIIPAIGGGPVPAVEQSEHKAIGSAASLPTIDDIAAAADLATLTAIRAELERAGALTDAINAAGAQRYQQLTASAAVPDAEGVYDAEVVDEDDAAAADLLWSRIVRAAGEQSPPMTTSVLNADFLKETGMPSNKAGVSVLEAYLLSLTGANA